MVKFYRYFIRMLDQAWCQARIDALKDRIVALEAAQDDLALGKIQAFTLDTGQSRQVITKKSLRSMETVIEENYNRLDALEMKCNGGQAIIARMRH